MTPEGAPHPQPLHTGNQAPATKKPRSRSILQSLFCCLCRDDGEPCASTPGAPLLVEENGVLPKVPPSPQPLLVLPLCRDVGLNGLPHSEWAEGVGSASPAPLNPKFACPPMPQAAVKHLLPEIKPQDASKLCVVIDLDETLVHSSFKVGNTPAPFLLLTPPALSLLFLPAPLSGASTRQSPAGLARVSL